MSGQNSAEAIALTALGHILQNEELRNGFLSLTGAGAEDLRRGAGDPVFLGAVLDFLLSDEPVLLDFAAERGLRPEAVVAARQALPGGDVPHWT